MYFRIIGKIISKLFQPKGCSSELSSYEIFLAFKSQSLTIFFLVDNDTTENLERGSYVIPVRYFPSNLEAKNFLSYCSPYSATIHVPISHGKQMIRANFIHEEYS